MLKSRLTIETYILLIIFALVQIFNMNSFEFLCLLLIQANKN